MAELVAALSVLGGSLALLFYLAVMKPPELYQDFTSVFWPTALSAVLACLSAIRCLQMAGGAKGCWRDWRVFKGMEAGGGMWVSLGMCLLYLAVLDILGYLLATPLFLVTFMYLLGVRGRRVLLLVPTAVVIVSVALFVKFMYIPLPKGWGLFRAINLLAY